MAKEYTREELIALGMNEQQISAILDTKENVEDSDSKIVNIAQAKDVKPKQLKVTSLSDIERYKNGVIVELPPFAEGQPFVARLTRPSMLQLVKTGKIPNSLIEQATSLFANGAGALNAGGKNKTNADELFEVIDTIVGAALQEPTLEEIRSVGMELSDDQLMAIFSYTQQGVKALEQFRTIRADS